MYADILNDPESESIVSKIKIWFKNLLYYYGLDFSNTSVLNYLQNLLTFALFFILILYFIANIFSINSSGNKIIDFVLSIIQNNLQMLGLFIVMTLITKLLSYLTWKRCDSYKSDGSFLKCYLEDILDAQPISTILLLGLLVLAEKFLDPSINKYLVYLTFLPVFSFWNQIWGYEYWEYYEYDIYDEHHEDDEHDEHHEDDK